MANDYDYDVIVVGSGAAGLSAALAASEAGCKQILITEGAHAVGGSSRLSGGIVMGSGSRLQRDSGIEDTPADLYAEYMSLNHWDVAAGPVKRFCERSGETIDWLIDHEVPFFQRLIFGGDERKPRSHCVDGGGQALVNALWSACQRAGIDIAFGRRVEGLVTKGGQVIGVTSAGESLTAPATILATGGFGANADLVKSHYPSAWYAGWTWYIGADGSRGDALRFAEQVGAQITAHDRGLRTLDTNYARLNEAFLPGWTLLVDTDGKRFCDETAPYGIIDTLVRSRGDRAFVLFDDAALRPPDDLRDRYRNAYKQVWPNHAPFRPKNYTADMIDGKVAEGRALGANSIVALEQSLGLTRGALEGEIRRYNSFAAAGHDGDFAKAAKFLLPLATAPFYAVEVRPTTITMTACGLRIDEYARVLHQSGGPITGLFAAGECTGGVLGPTYMGSGNSLANACGMGRIAGESAAHALARGSADTAAMWSEHMEYAD